MKQKWLMPLHIGVSAGVIIGTSAALKIVLLRQHYLDYHLYNTAIRTLAEQIDIYVLTATAFLYSGFLVVGLISFFRNRGKRPVNVLSVSVFLTAAALSILHADRSAQALGGAVSEGSFKDIGLPIIYCVVTIAAALLLIRALRNRSLMVLLGPLRVTARLASGVCRLLSAVFIPCLATLILVNAAAGILTIRAKAFVRERPNIIFIMVDTLRADHLGCYGYPINTSPNIDKFASESIRFNEAVAQAPFTFWSVPSFMTSSYPQDVPSLENGFLDDRCLTLSEALKESGYNTSAVISNPAIDSNRGYLQGFDSFNDKASAMDVSSPLVLAGAKDQIQRLKDSKFFLFLLFMDTHSPYTLHDQYDISRKYHNEPVQSIEVGAVGDPYSRGKDRRFPALPFYDSEIRFTDEYVGKVLDELKSKNLYDDSLIIFLADHGEEFLDHGNFFHGTTLYHEVLHVPLIVKLPKQHTGRVVDGESQLLDVFPSIMRLLNCDTSHMRLQGDGLDFQNVHKLPGRQIFSAGTGKAHPLRSVTTDTYKYILELQTNKEQLYVTLRDPNETKNIAAMEPGVSSTLRRLVMERDEKGKSLRAWGSGLSKPPKITEQEEERLRHLGYLAN